MCNVCGCTQSFDPRRHDVHSAEYQGDPLAFGQNSPTPSDAVSGTSWGQTRTVLGDAGGVVTYSIADAGNIFNAGGFGSFATVDQDDYYGDIDFEAELAAVFDLWSAAANIEFVQVTDGGGNSGTNTNGDLRIFFGDLPNSVIGLAYIPSSFPFASDGDMIFDDVDTSTSWGLNVFRALLAHEIGHAIGLEHVPNGSNSVMTPTVGISAPTAFDIQATQIIYGVQDNAPPVLNLKAGQSEMELVRGLANLTVNGNTLNNTITGTDAAEIINGAAGNDTLMGRDGNDTLEGGSNNDFLDGGLGQDSMSGGDGDDTYLVDHLLDVVSEGDGAQSGTDTVWAQVSYNLNQQSQNIENLTLTGTAFGATGNSIANTLTGNTSNNLIAGAAGNDTLLGNGGQDTLLGGANDDQLDGGSGVDRNIGGFGNDTYFVDDFNDRVVEFLGEGTDSVFSSVSFSLLFNSNNIEDITLTGGGNINASGNNTANTIIGNNGNNVLNGASGFDVLRGNDGNDTLNGGTGEDTLDGGAGDDVMNGGFDAQTDTFVFANGFGNDVIQNYDFGEDVIDLSAVSAITDFADLEANHLTQIGFSAVITDGSNTITILNRNESAFTADDFNFA
ncbi:MAG: matrixin family metalloprotease [Pseudomonadota bacterium]